VIRRLGWLLAIVVLGACGIYTAVYLNRWEWNRALFVAVLFVAVEVAMATMLVLGRIRRLEERVRTRDAAPRALQHIRATRTDRDHFAWLERSTRDLNVFVTVLLGAGVLLSAGTWLIDRIASRTALPTLERGLAARLAPMEFPTDPLVPDDEELLAAGGPYGEDRLDILLGPRP
jgi:hypothetical protein